MGPLSFLREFWLDLVTGSRQLGARRKSPPLHPESLWRVTLSDDRIAVVDPGGEAAEMAKADLLGVVIETNDSGPWGADFWWLLFGPDGKAALVFPQGATGDKEAMD